jgi:thiol-disulfide isomerase/thioredoxin
MKIVQKMGFLFIFIVPAVGLAQQGSTITGKLLGSDHNPMLMSHVRLAGGGGFSESDRSLDDPEFASVQADSDGSFKISTDSLGALTLMFTGVGHTMLGIPLILEHATNLALRVQLEPLNLIDDFSDAEICYDFDEVARGKKGHMRETVSKVYRFELPTEKKEVEYRIGEIGGSAWGVSIPSSTANTYEYFREGIYNSIVYPVNGIIKIILDDTQPRLPKLPATLSFIDTQSVQSEFLSYYHRFQKEKEKYENALQNHMKRGGKVAHFSYNWTPFRDQIKEDILRVHDTILADELAIEFLETVILSRRDRGADYCRRQIGSVSPSSFAWVYHGSAALQSKRFHPLGGMYIQDIISSHPSFSFRANMIYHMCSYAKHERKELTYHKLFSALVKEYGKTPAGHSAITGLKRLGESQIGKTVPSFVFTSLDSGKYAYTNEDFAGKYLLIDFWATWCGPCVGEMKYLHDAFSRYHNSGFEILSVSFDTSPSHVKHFRSTRWKMPWPNSYVEEDKRSSVYLALDVHFPKPMLISPSGTILEIDDALRGEKLEETLERYLSKQ